MKKVFVVIPNWNGLDLLEPCLQSLAKQTFQATVVLVDNGSEDGSSTFVKTNFPEVRVLELDKNHGFAGGVNAGIRYALEQGAEAVALLNNDAVADKNWLKELVNTMEKDTQRGIVVAKLLRDDAKHLDSAGDCYSVWGMPFPRGRNQLDTGQYDAEEEVFSASGGASLYSARLLQAIGLFDERFFAYYEDNDISFRAQLAGWKVIYTPKAHVLHSVSATSERLGSFTRYHATKNFYMQYLKNMPGWLFYKYLPLFALQGARLCATSLLKGHIVVYLQSIGRVILNTPYLIRERRRIQKKRTVSTSYIDSILYKHRPPRFPRV